MDRNVCRPNAVLNFSANYLVINILIISVDDKRAEGHVQGSTRE